MNPKAPSNLDPKLKETYERVMGTSFVSTTPPTQMRPVQTTVAEESQAPIAPEPIAADPPLVDVANPTQEMVQSPQMPKIGEPFKETVFAPAATVTMKDKTSIYKKKNILQPVLWVVGGLIFFVAYAVIWAKVFKLF